VTESELAGQLERLREQQRAVSEVLGAVARGEGVQPVFDAVVEAANRLCDGESSGLWIFDGSFFRAEALIGAAPGQLEWEREHPHVADRSTLTGRVVVTGAVVHIPDAVADPEYQWAGQSMTPYRAMLGVPIIADDELLGVLAVTRTVPEPFTDDAIRLVTTFADQASIAIANARLLEAVERQLEQQRAISDVLSAVAHSGRLEAVFSAVVDAANRICDGEYSALYLAEGDLFRVSVYGAGSEEQFEYERSHPHTRDRKTLVGRVALTREAVHIPDALADPEYSWEGQSMGGYRSMVGVPVIVDDDLFGVIGVVRTISEPFTDEQIQLLRAFADQAAFAIANARLLDAVERQRTELSRFVSPRVAELLSSEDGERLLAGHRAYVSVLFCDLRGFTAFAETAAPEELFEVLRDYHAVVGELIAKHDGTLEHFAGDGLMMFFNDPATVNDHETEAVRMAVALRERFADLASLWQKRGIELGLGIGIAAGYATLGRIGFEGRYDYGALGPVTNLASRLSTHAAPGQILISQRVLAAVEDVVDAHPVGELELKGFGRPVAAYEVRALGSS
jgi:class 3 adenylate cyclase/putative methionine-R-sulfoxide reductase with GAF domain